MTYEEFKALSRSARREYILVRRERGKSDRQIAMELGLKHKQVSNFYHITERLGLQVSKAKDRRFKETLCWECKNACGGCSWSQSFDPVPGWEVIVQKPRGEQTPRKLRGIPDYRVISCPEYVRG